MPQHSTFHFDSFENSIVGVTELNKISHFCKSNNRKVRFLYLQIQNLLFFSDSVSKDTVLNPNFCDFKLSSISF